MHMQFQRSHFMIETYSTSQANKVLEFQQAHKLIKSDNFND